MKAKRQTALITGATSGIGYDFANVFAAKGYDLFLASRNREKLSGIKKKFENIYGTAVSIMPIDLAKHSSARKVFDRIRTQKIDIDILVNNAGIGMYGEHVDLDMEKVASMIQLNITTPTELCSLFGNAMKRKKRGYILNVASAAAYQPGPYIAFYAACKRYVLNFSEALAKELEGYNVFVTCLSPGATRTNFFKAAGVAKKAKGIWSKDALMSSREVAEIGVKALFAKKLSLVPGKRNFLLTFSKRLAPRKAAASISKKVMEKAVRK
jgi:hypothetical protein